MVSRSESAASTRHALLRAASQLLDEGGPGAVTLREVGSRAGVSRGAPYGHFEDKRRLLARLAVDAWNDVADSVARIRGDSGATPTERLERAVTMLVEVARRRPHLYALMFSTPADDPEAAEAASRLESEFLAIVGGVVGEGDAQRYGALVMSSAHGIAGLELSGHLATEKWGVGPDELVHLLVEAIGSRADTAGDD